MSQCLLKLHYIHPLHSHIHVGHVVCMRIERYLHTALCGQTDSTRPVGRPKKRWIDVREDCVVIGLSLSAAAADRLAKDKSTWSISVNKARFPFKRNRLRCVRCVNENCKKRKRLRWQAANQASKQASCLLLENACQSHT